MKRLGIFIFYDEQGIVDDYVQYLLDAMSQVCTEIVSVCNGNLCDEERQKLEKYCVSITCRENYGMDAGAIKDYFLNIGSTDYWQSFDQVVWFNDTCYGPIYPIQEMFDEMSGRDSYDFWGVTAHSRANVKWAGSTQDGIAEHIQSYFMVVNQKLLKDRRFLEFWRNVNISNNFHKTVANYEIAMTRTFASWGYSYGVYCDLRERDTNADYVCNQTAEAMYELVAFYRCPFIKRKNFIRQKEESTANRYGEQVPMTMAFIRQNNLYDTALIYHNLMRLYGQSQWSVNIPDCYVLSSETSEKNICPDSLILAELNHKDTVTELSQFLTGLLEGCSLIAVTEDENLIPEIKCKLPVSDVLLMPEKSRGLPGLMNVLQSMDYDRYSYFCLLQEAWGEPENDLHLPQTSMRYMEYGNLVAGPCFINNVLQTFQNNPLLGVMETLQNNPMFGVTETLSCFKKQIYKVKKIDPQDCLNELGIKLTCRVENQPVVCKGSFWCRKEVIQEVLRLTDGHLLQMKEGWLEKLLSTFALNAGYYCAEVVEEHWAAFRLSDLQREYMTTRDEQSIKCRILREKFREAIAINQGRLKPEDSNFTVFSCFGLLMTTLWYSIEKKINHNIPDEKRNSFFLGFRDIFQTLIKLIK